MDTFPELQNQDGYLKGTCLTMCPSQEIQLRIKENLIDKLEKRVIGGQRTEFADTRLMVKEFSRCSAGHKIKPSDVRPIPVLLKTVKYLFSVVCSNEDVSWREIYDFVDNRFRAVRQDVIVQGVTSESVLNIFCPAARFYVYSNYRLCDSELSEFDPHLNLKQLREILLTVLPIIRENAVPVETFTTEAEIFNRRKGLLAAMEKMSLFNTTESEEAHSGNEDNSSDEEYENSYETDPNREKNSLYQEIISLHVIINIGRPDVIREILDMPFYLRQDGILSELIKSSISWLQGNHIPLIRLAPTLSPILATALVLRLNEIQRHVLGVSSRAYNSNVLHYKIEDLKNLLLFSSEESLRKACHYYGLTTSNEGVLFNKGNFKWDVPMLAPEKADWVDKKLHESRVSDLLLIGPSEFKHPCK